MHLEHTMVQFLLFCEEVRLSLSIPTLCEGTDPKPPHLDLGKHSEDEIFIIRGWVYSCLSSECPGKTSIHFPVFLSQIHVVAGVKAYVPNSLLFGGIWSFCVWLVRACHHNKGKTDLRSELTARLQYVSFPGVTGNSSHWSTVVSHYFCTCFSGKRLHSNR